SHTYTYALIAGAGSSGNGAFAITGNALRTAAAFDYEAQATYSIRVRSTDETGSFTDQALTVQVLNVANETAGNTPPTLTGVPVSVNVTESNAVAFDADATDPDGGQTLTFSLDGAPTGAAIDPSTGAFSWTPSEAQGPDTFV